MRKAAVNEPSAGFVQAWQRRLSAVGGKVFKHVKALPKRIKAHRKPVGLSAGHGGVVCLGNGTSFVDIGDRLYDKNLEPLLDALRIKGVPSAMLTPGYAYPSPCATPQIYVQGEMDWTAAKGIFGPCPRFRDARMSGLAECVDFLNNCNMLGSGQEVVDIQKGFGHIFRFKDLFLKHLRCLEARLGMVVTFHTEAGMGFNLACRELGIPNVVVQHGIQSEAHPLFGGWQRIPREGYELLPSHFWVRSVVDAAKFEECMQHSETHDVIVGGNPFLLSWQDEGNDFVVVHDVMIRNLKAIADRCLHVLVALNGVAAEEDDQLVKVVELAAERGESVHFWMRSHPCRLEHGARLKARLSRAGRVMCSFDEATDLPLYALMRHVNVLLTMFSSTAAEGVDFGLNTVFLDPMGTALYQKLLPGGTYVYGASPEEALGLLKTYAVKDGVYKTEGGQCLERGIKRLHSLIREGG